MSVHFPETRDNEFARGIDYFSVGGNFSPGRQRGNSITRDYYRLVSEDVPGPDVDYCGVSKDKRTGGRRSCRRRACNGCKHQEK
jgi:hypothetical protein